MAQSLNRAGSRLALHSICLFLSACAAAAQAQDNLPDPTRPPSSLHAGAVATPSGPAGPVLQSVLISPKRRVAVINGDAVQVGDRVGDARVLRIAEGEVVLVRGAQSETLKLFPGIEKRQAKNSASVPGAGRRQ